MKQSVLVVDDESMARDLLRLILERAGFRVLEAKDGFDALDKIEEDAPDLVLLDVMMPGLDGIGVCMALREEEMTADLPVILLSARTHASAVEEGLAAGANRYLSKLTPRKELIQNINELLDETSSA